MLLPYVAVLAALVTTVVWYAKTGHSTCSSRTPGRR
jgi:hypothetical protein